MTGYAISSAKSSGFININLWVTAYDRMIKDEVMQERPTASGHASTQTWAKKGSIQN
jgi:hypothetical protein